jgi:hypothetical protein
MRWRWSVLVAVGCGPLVEVPERIEVHVSTPGTGCSQGDEATSVDDGIEAGFIVNRVDDFVTVELEDELDAFDAPVTTSTTFVASGSSTWTGTPIGGYTTAIIPPDDQVALAVSASVGCKTFGEWPDGVYTRKVTVTAWGDDEYDEKTYKFPIDVVVD